MNVLDKIFEERKSDIENAKKLVPQRLLEKMAESRSHHSLIERLSVKSGTVVIAEMKQASPSAGLIRPDYHPGEIAELYVRAGAAGISVLTEPRHFLGKDDHLREVRQRVNVPVLRKDFICDPYQIYESAAMGADVILLILAWLTDELLADLYNTAISLGLDVLAEAHNELEINRAASLDKAIIGVNSRNLKTLVTDLIVAEELAEKIPNGRISVAESGIKTRSDIVRLQDLGYDGFLVGESIIGKPDPGKALRQFIG